MEEIPLDDQVRSLTRGVERLGGAGPIPDGMVDIPLRSPGRPAESEDAKQKRHREISAQALHEVKTYKELSRRTDWINIPYNKGVGISTFELEPYRDPMADNELVYTVRATGVVTGKTATLIARKHLDCNHSSRCSWDTNISDIGFIEEIMNNPKTRMNLSVMYVVVTPPAWSLVAPREFVNFQFARETPSAKNPDDSAWTIITRHTSHPRRPVTDRFVRALSMTAMEIVPLTPDKDKDSVLPVPRTSVTITGWLNPKGSLPASIVTYYKTALADRIEFLQSVSFM